MLTIRDLQGNEELLTDYKELTKNRKVNGEKSISLTILPTVHNAHSFHLVEEESTIDFDGEEYIIKKMAERNIGNTYIKRVEAIHKFYVDMINKQQPLVHNGSKTFADYLNFVFSGTGYTYSIIDSFYAQDFENLGNDNRLALLQKGLERYKAEMEIVGTDVRFKKQVGNDTDFQFRYAHNVKAIEKSVDTTNLATVISGTGAEGITAYYRSPNADIFGEIDAPPVNDERFTTEASLLEEMKARLEDTPEFSITIDFVDLRAAGYPWTVPNEGDSVYVIYEPMNDLLIETRILEINEVYDANGNVIKTNVTLANYKKTFAGTLFDNVQKQLRSIVNDDGAMYYNVLPEAVKLATEALKSAQTELEFENGIIGRDPENPNNLVLFTSAGIGISTDGGNTFKEAITKDGFVLSAGAIGQLAANNIQIGAATTYEAGYDPTKIQVGGRNLYKDSAKERSTTRFYSVSTFDILAPYIGKQIVVSFDIKAQYARNIRAYPYQSNGISIADSYLFVPPTDSFQRFSFVTTVKDWGIQDETYSQGSIGFYDDAGDNNYTLKNIKIELGNKATDWTPAPEDIKADLRLTAPLPTSLTMNQNGITASTSDPTKYARLDHRGLYIQGGAVQINGGLPDSQIANASKWNSQGTYIDSTGVYTGTVEADQINTTTLSAITANLGTVTTGKLVGLTADDLYIGSDGAKIDVTKVNSTIPAIRINSSSNNYYRVDNRPAHMMMMDGNWAFWFTQVEAEKHRMMYFGNVGLKGLNGTLNQVQVRNYGDTAYASMAASEFVTGSRREWKKNIEPYPHSALDKINSMPVYYYHLNRDQDSEPKRIGLIYEEADVDVVDPSGQGVIDYALSSLTAKAIQELSAKVTELEARIKTLEGN